MTYLNAYSTLEKTGRINQIINYEIEQGSDKLEVEKAIIESIEYYLKYWSPIEDNMQQRVNKAICKKLAQWDMERVVKKESEYQAFIDIKSSIL